MAEVSFQPAAADRSFADDFNTGVTNQQSMMERATRNRLLQQQEQANQEQMAQAKILAPVIQAKAQADILSAHASVANNARLEALRGQAAAVSKPANDEFLDAMQLADFNVKATELAKLQAKYQWMSLIPEYKGFVDTINDERIKAHGSAIADAHMETQLEAANASAQARYDLADLANQNRLDLAALNNDARRDVAEIGANSREAVANTSAESRREQARQKADKQYELEVTVEARDEAVRNGDNERAQIYQDRINKMNSTSATTQDRPVPTSVPSKRETAKPTAPVKFDLGVTAKSPSVDIGGVTYPIFKDKHGNRAYLKDGQYIEIAPEDTPAQE